MKDGLERALEAQAKRTPPDACETCGGCGVVYVPRAGWWYEHTCSDCDGQDIAPAWSEAAAL